MFFFVNKTWPRRVLVPPINIRGLLFGTIYLFLDLLSGTGKEMMAAGGAPTANMIGSNYRLTIFGKDLARPAFPLPP